MDAHIINPATGIKSSLKGQNPWWIIYSNRENITRIFSESTNNGGRLVKAYTKTNFIIEFETFVGRDRIQGFVDAL